MSKRPSALGKPTGVDYAVMIGGPVAFIAILVWAIYFFLGPAPPANPVSKLKRGAVSAGMSTDQVRAEVGEPKSIEPRPDGGFTYVYHRGTEEPFVEEDALVAFSASGYVISVSFERTAVPVGE